MKYRNELKYLISEDELVVLKRELDSFMSIDKHAPEGIYTISSLYFDDLYDQNYYDVDAGSDLKNKYRIRIYDHKSDYLALKKLEI